MLHQDGKLGLQILKRTWLRTPPSQTTNERKQTDWVSPIVVVPKKEGKIRICVDMRAASTAVKRIRHPIPTVKDMALELNGAKYLSKTWPKRITN